MNAVTIGIIFLCFCLIIYALCWAAEAFSKLVNYECDKRRIR